MRDGNMIREGYNTDVDTSAYGQDRRKDLACPDLKRRSGNAPESRIMQIKYNKVFGYYLEVTNSYKDLVPDYYIRKQTLTNAERYITPEVKRTGRYDSGRGRQAVSHWSMNCSVKCGIRLLQRCVRIQKTAQGSGAA